MAKYCMLLVALVILLAGCSKLSRENYDKLKVGMEYDDVEKILGKPDICTDTLIGKGCTWGSERKNITLAFIGNKIIMSTSKNLD
jgi:Domain of Unknown Function with PDB structure (DUF3862)